MKSILITLALAALATAAHAEQPVRKDKPIAFVWSAEQSPILTFPTRGPGFLTIYSKGREVVRINVEDGAVTLAPDATPDEAARAFWAAVEAMHPARSVTSMGR